MIMIFCWCKCMALCQLRARRVLLILKLCSVENQKGVIDIKNVPLRTRRVLLTLKMFRWKPEGCYCCTKYTAIAPFWISTEHLWILITPFWFSTEHLWIALMPFWFSADNFRTFLWEIEERRERVCRVIDLWNSRINWSKEGWEKWFFSPWLIFIKVQRATRC